MLVQYCINNNGDYGGEVGLTTNFDEDNNEATSLEDGAKRSKLALPAKVEGASNKNLPAIGYYVSVALLDRVFDIHWEMAQPIDLERLTNAAQDEQHLHLHLLTSGTDGSNNVM